MCPSRLPLAFSSPGDSIHWACCSSRKRNSCPESVTPATKPPATPRRWVNARRQPRTEFSINYEYVSGRDSGHGRWDRKLLVRSILQSRGLSRPCRILPHDPGNATLSRNAYRDYLGMDNDIRAIVLVGLGQRFRGSIRVIVGRRDPKQAESCLHVGASRWQGTADFLEEKTPHHDGLPLQNVPFSEAVRWVALVRNAIFLVKRTVFWSFSNNVTDLELTARMASCNFKYTWFTKAILSSTDQA